MQQATTGGVYRFGDYTLDVGARSLISPLGRPINLTSRAFDTLLELVRHQGETVSKMQLMETVWPDAVVEENNLNQAILSIRKALRSTGQERAASSKSRQYIQTVPGRGYCLVVPVEKLSCASAVVVDDNEQRGGRNWQLPPVHYLSLGALLLLAVIAIALWHDTQAPTAVEAVLPLSRGLANENADAPLVVPDTPVPELIPDSIAVMPFTNLTPGPENALFTLGLHDEVINQLAKVKTLKVMSRGRIMALAKQDQNPATVGKLLQVESVMTGTLMFIGQQARVSLQLQDPRSGLTLWASTYEAEMHDLSNLISIQSDIALNVASALQAEIQENEQATIRALPTESFEAYRFNLAARQAHYNMNHAKAWALSKRAIELDPTYVEALYNHATINAVLSGTPLRGMSARDHNQALLDAANRMIEVAPGDSRGYRMKVLAMLAEQNWHSVPPLVDRLKSLGIPLHEIKNIGIYFLSIGDADTAIEIYESNMVIEPVNFYGRGFLLAALEIAGRREQARAEYALGEELKPIWWGDTVNIFLALGRGEPLVDIDELPIPADIKQVLKQVDKPEVLAKSLRNYRMKPDKFSAEALYYSALAAYSGDNALAIELLDVALAEVGTNLFWSWLPVFDEVRQDPAFPALLEKVGIVDFWNTYGWPDMCQPRIGTVVCDWRAYPDKNQG